MKTKQKNKKGCIVPIIRLFFILFIASAFLKGGGSILGSLLKHGKGLGIDDIAGYKSEIEEYMNDIVDRNDVNETKDILKSMGKQDKRIKKILDNYNDYPEELLEMLSRNIEMADFVLEYPNKKGKIYAETIGDTKKGVMPMLLQYDERWGYGEYGNNIIAINGCGPTALSMVVAKLTGDNEVTPYKVAKFSEENGYFVNDLGTSWSLFTEGSRNFGVQGKEIPLAEGSIYNALKSGKPIICSVRPGDFTTTGHIIVLTEIKEGKISVYDPNSSERSNELWDYKTLEGQIRNLWAFNMI